MDPVTDLMASDAARERTLLGGSLSPLRADVTHEQDGGTAAASSSVASPFLAPRSLADADRAPRPLAATHRDEDLWLDDQETTAELTVSAALPAETPLAVWQAYPEVLSLDVPPIPEVGTVHLAVTGALLLAANSVLRRRHFGVRS
jgi:hypothetical protein